MFIDAIKLLSYEAFKLLGDEAIRQYGHMAVHTELYFQILNLVRNPFLSEPMSTFTRNDRSPNHIFQTLASGLGKLKLSFVSKVVVGLLCTFGFHFFGEHVGV